MGYWLVMAIVAIAVVAVLIAVGSEEDEPEPHQPNPAGRPIWVAIGTNGNAPGVTDEVAAPKWVDLVRESLGGRVIGYDFTSAGCTAEEAQRHQLAAAVATRPDAVSIFLGPDDFRDAEDLGVFERRFWHILTTLRNAEGIPVVAMLPDLTRLPSLAAEDNPESLAEELQSWNVAIARLVAAADGKLIDAGESMHDAADDLFTERGGRFILTAAGQSRFASLMEQPVKRVLGLTDVVRLQETDGEASPGPTFDAE
jgi:GDSL-like Lipase/Acylhydrolase family